MHPGASLDTAPPGASPGTPHLCKEVKQCGASVLCINAVLLAIDATPINGNGTMGLTEGREDKWVEFRWLTSRGRRADGGGVAVAVVVTAAGKDKSTLDVVRHGRRMKLCTLVKILTQ